VDEMDQPTGIIGNEGLFIRSAEESIMTFHVGRDFSADVFSFDSDTDLEGNTVSTLSAILYEIGD
jgi:hypothetical protein